MNPRLTAAPLLLGLAGGMSIGGCTGSDPVEIEQTTVHPRHEAFLQQMVEEERFSGVALVMSDGEVVHAKAYGEASPGRPNALATEFHVASITKHFTASAVLLLVDQGRMRLDTSINEYLPERYRTPRWDALTVHHLLAHTGGVPDYALERDYYHVVDGFCLGDTIDGMVRECMATELEFEPGSRFSYSNIGYTLRGLAIEEVASTPFDVYLKEQVFEPVGMGSSRIHMAGHVPGPNEAAGHRWNEELDRHVHDAVVTLPVTPGDGCLVTTASDFVRWSARFIDDRPEPLSRDSFSRMITPVATTDIDHPMGLAEEYGYGLLLGSAAISHSGYIVGFRSHFVVVPEERWLVLVFTNNTTNDPVRIGSGLLRILQES